MEERLEKQKVGIQAAKSELNGNEEVVMDGKHEKGVVKDIEFLKKHSEAFMLKDLSNYDKNLCADTGKYEVGSKQEIVFEYHT